MVPLEPLCSCIEIILHQIILGCLPRALSLTSSARQKLNEATIIDEMRVLPLSRSHVLRGYVDLPYLLVWVALM